MTYSRSDENRRTAVAIGVAAGLASLVGLLGSDIPLTADQPFVLVAALAATSLGVGSVGTVSWYLFVEQSLLVPAVAGFGYVGVVTAGVFLGQQPAAVETLLTKWLYAAGVVLAGGAVEYAVRRGVQRAVGRLGPRPLH
ncbi:hypothetical protein [Halobacterium jilantaiense]|uniref:Uncharacterized protein n=1 Tax=Halobacterium jilantaiense TaxID=355548 RepID=A0A1I0NTX3_9EURY|nr:hypothetical protein [Halobacterium jilantaiense]SEW05034.1 hypothetical protein SAMN04487945_1142 [Halobacterium jilantaiense]